MDKPQIIGHIQKSLNFTLYDCKWIPCSAKFIVIGSNPRGTGALQIYEIEKTDVKLIKEMEKPKSFKCGTFGASRLQDRNLATGDFEGNLQIWDLEHSDRPIYSVKGHKEIINAIDGIGGLGVGEGAAELATASRDGTVKIWDPRQNDPVATIEPSSGTDTTRDCWAVAFGNAYNSNDRCVCAGYDNGDVKLVDLRAMKLKWETNLRNGICSLQFDRPDIDMNKLAVATLEGGLHVIDVRAQFATVKERASAGATVWAVRHLPTNRDVFMTAGGAGSLHLWQYHYPAKRIVTEPDSEPRGMPGTLELLQNITLSSQPISSFDWSRDKQGLAVCTSFDQTLRVLIVTKLNTL